MLLHRIIFLWWAFAVSIKPAASATCSAPWLMDATVSIAFTKEVEPTNAQALLPGGLTPVLVPSTYKLWSNASIAAFVLRKYAASPFGAYSEMGIAVEAHHAASNTTGNFFVALYNDSPAAAKCSQARWGHDATESHFEYSSSKVPILGDADTITIKESSSVFAKLFGELTVYYNHTLPPPAPVDPTLCDSQWSEANCTLRSSRLVVNGTTVRTDQEEFTGDVGPAFAKFIAGEGLTWSALGIQTNTGPAPSQVTTRQVEATALSTASVPHRSGSLPKQLTAAAVYRQSI